MPRKDERDRTGMSRREAGRVAAAAIAGAVLTTCVPAGGQAPAGGPPADADTRLALIEKSLGRALSEDQRKAVLEGIKGTDDAWAKGRAEFTVPDGTEPDFVFRPTPLAPASKERPHA